MRGRKKRKALGVVEVVDRDRFDGMELDAKEETIKGLVPSELMHGQELLEEQVKELAQAGFANLPLSQDAIKRDLKIE